MSSNPPEPGAPESHVYRAHNDINGLSQIAPETWQQIVQHVLPLQPANAAVRLIVVTGTATRCNSIEALQVQTDNFGFLANWDANLTQSLPPLYPADKEPELFDQQKSNVIDSRQQFLRRYLTHRHNWQPPARLLAEALLRSGYAEPAPYPGE